jgi:hypothetical protein
MSQTQEFEKSLTGSPASVAHFEERRSPLNRLQHVLHGNPALVPLIVLVALILFFGFAAGERFFRASTLTLVLQQVAVVGILAAAQTLVVLTAGIDLAIGVIMVFSFVVMGNLVVANDMPAGVALLAGFALAAFWGFTNGNLVARLKLPPFIVTLGMWNVIMAICLIYSRNETIRQADVVAQTQWLHVFAINFKVGPAVVTLGVVAMIVLYAALWFMLNHTAFGRHIYAGQALRPRHRPRQCRLRPDAGRDPRRHRRQRRGQIDAHQGALRRRDPGPGRDPARRPAVHFRTPDRSARGRDRDGLPDLAMSPALSIADNMFLGREMAEAGIMGTVFRQLDRPGWRSSRATS